MDVGVGGLLTTLSKMALINGVGFNIDLSRVPVDECRIDRTWWRSPRPTLGMS